MRGRECKEKGILTETKVLHDEKGTEKGRGKILEEDNGSKGRVREEVVLSVKEREVEKLRETMEGNEKKRQRERDGIREEKKKGER